MDLRLAVRGEYSLAAMRDAYGVPGASDKELAEIAEGWRPYQRVTSTGRLPALCPTPRMRRYGLRT